MSTFLGHTGGCSHLSIITNVYGPGIAANGLSWPNHPRSEKILGPRAELHRTLRLSSFISRKACGQWPRHAAMAALKLMTYVATQE